MKYVQIGNTSFSKIVCGTNPFYGRAHFSSARDAEYSKRFNDVEIKNVVNACFDKGINTLESSANERIFGIFSELIVNHPGKQLSFIGSTRIDNTSTVKRHQEKLDMLIHNKSSICIIHSQYIEKELRGNSINGIELLLDIIHQHGLLAGISTHSNGVIELCERNKYPIDIYMFPLNISGFAYPGYAGHETPSERASLIKSIEKPFIIMKALAAGRIPPSEALEFVHKNMKSNDLLSIGFGSIDEVNETIDIWEKIEKDNQNSFVQHA
jgi:hypothetical protein